MKWAAGIALLLALPATAAAQTQTGVVANGQIFLPNGRPITTEIRFQLHSDSYRRPPEYHYTDSRGRFLINVQSGVMYVITVESDGETWATTRYRFLISGTHPRVDVFLEPYRRDPASPHPDHTVSLAGLQQNVPGEARKQFEAGVKSVQKGNPNKGRQHFQQAIQLFPDYVDARNELGALLMRENRLAEAEALLRRAVEIDPQSARPLLNLGLCLSRQERFADAEPFLERAVQSHPLEPTGSFLLGVALLMTGQETDAERLLLRAYDLGGARMAHAQFYLAKLYLRRNEPARAVAALEKYLEHIPQDPNAPQLRATIGRLRERKSATP